MKKEPVRTIVKYAGKESLFIIKNPKDHIQKYIQSSKTFYEIGMLEDIRQRVSGNENLIVDAGAYIGNHSIFFATHCGAHVISFEPFVGSYRNLMENIQANKLEDKIIVHNVALGRKKTTANMKIADIKNAGMNRIVSNEAGDTKVTTLDAVMYKRVPRMDILKIDVEGMEVELLKGGIKSIKLYSPMIYVEAFEEERLAEIKSILEPLGYSIQGVFNSTPTYLFVRKPNQHSVDLVKKAKNKLKKAVRRRAK